MKDAVEEDRRPGTWTREQYLETVRAGSYPEALTRTPRRRGAWFDNYINRIMARDVQDLSRLAHLDLLETLYLIPVLPAWGGNLTKRVAGRPKVALLDTGLAARLNHVTPAAMAPGAASDAAGGLLESFVAGELRRQLVWADTPARLFHFRDRDGREVDIVVESDARRVAGVEMKAAGSVSKSDFKGLTFLRDKLKGRFAMGVVLYTGTRPVPFGDRLWALPYSAMWT